MNIIEIDSIESVKNNSNLFNSTSATIQRKFGNRVEHIFKGVDCGTIKLVNGACVDYWRDALTGEIIFEQAK